MSSAHPTIGFLGAGEMGAAMASLLTEAGFKTFAIEVGRSPQTLARMDDAGMERVPDIATLTDLSDIVISVLPPKAAEFEASRVAEHLLVFPKSLVFVEANAISPDRVQRIARLLSSSGVTVIDGGIVGPPPSKARRPRLYVSGPNVGPLAMLDGIGFELCPIGHGIGRASGLKMLYAAITKGTNALLTAGYLASEKMGLAEEFRAELSDSQTALFNRAEANISRLPSDAGRWIFEMLEIAATYENAGLPRKFHDAAAEIMQLLAESEFGVETRRTRDWARSARETTARIAATLPH